VFAWEDQSAAAFAASFLGRGFVGWLAGSGDVLAWKIADIDRMYD
jgi:hypothetical protein